MRVIIKLQTSTNTQEASIDVNTALVVGRSSMADVKIPDELMSKSHCRMILKPSKLEVIDLGSKNGTYLNGIRVDHAEVFMGDIIRIGETVVTIDQSRMDDESIETLTFPGPIKSRVSHELKMDFTGVRQANQTYFDRAYGKAHNFGESPEKEIEIRKKAKCKIKLSKYEIKLRNKMRATLASTIDILITLMVIATPLVLLNVLLLTDYEFDNDSRLLILLTVEVFLVGLFYYLNFNFSRFSLGEKFAGIQSLYLNQD